MGTPTNIRIVPPALEFDDAEPFSSSSDIFLHKPFAEALTKLVRMLREPTVIAIDGEWGSGKSTFLRRWKKALEAETPNVPVIYFDAFENDYVEDAFAALVREVIALLEAQESGVSKEFKEKAIACGRILLRASLRVATKAVVRAASANTLTAGDISDAIAAAETEAVDATGQLFDELLDGPNKQRDTIQQFRDALSQLPQALSKPTESNVPLVFIIDELDRCKPSFALSILERIKHFMTVPNVHFVLGVHLRQLRNSVKAEYGARIDANLYLQKFIALDFTLPVPDDSIDRRNDIYLSYILSKLQLGGHALAAVTDISRHISRISTQRKLSLRCMERIVSVVVLFVALHEKATNQSRYGLIAVLCTLKVVAPDLFVKAERGQLNFADVLPYTGIPPLGRHEDKWHLGLWHFLLDADEIPEASQYRSAFINFDRQRIVPFHASLLNTLA